MENKINKQQKELLKLIDWDLNMVNTNELDEDSRYFLELARGNLKDLIKELKLGERL
jgi:hypothetical protein